MLDILNETLLQINFHLFVVEKPHIVIVLPRHHNTLSSQRFFNGSKNDKLRFKLVQKHRITLLEGLFNK